MDEARMMHEIRVADECVGDISACKEAKASPTIKTFLEQRRYLLSALDATNAILSDPQKWMKWCDVRVLEENESLRAQLANARAENEQLRRGEFICNRCHLRKDSDDVSGEPEF